jgi:hypothetical protein
MDPVSRTCPPQSPRMDAFPHIVASVFSPALSRYLGGRLVWERSYFPTAFFNSLPLSLGSRRVVRRHGSVLATIPPKDTSGITQASDQDALPLYECEASSGT